MAVLEITSRQFRDKQKYIFDLADRGEMIVIKRGKAQAYVLTPVNGDDFLLTPEFKERIERSRQQAREGKVTVCKTAEESLKLLDAL
jgi:hypothetical protein